MYKNIYSMEEAICENCIYFKESPKTIRAVVDQAVCIQSQRIPTNIGVGYWPVTSRESYCGMGVWYYYNKQKSYEAIVDLFRSNPDECTS